MSVVSVPDGFIPLPRSSPLLGPVYCRDGGWQLEIGLPVESRHANGRGTSHGGVLAPLAVGERRVARASAVFAVPLER